MKGNVSPNPLLLRGTTMKLFNSLPKVSPNSMTARFLLAFLATAGFFYVNIMPALVDGLPEVLIGIQVQES